MQRQYTSRSDVWSFGVTLWEMLSFARCRPFDWLSDSQLVRDYVLCCSSPTPSSSPAEYQLLATPPRLPQPRVCPREIYDLLLECWNVDGSQRPTFREIHMFLTRKGIGYRHDADGTFAPTGGNDGGTAPAVEFGGNDNPAAAVIDLMG